MKNKNEVWSTKKAVERCAGDGMIYEPIPGIGGVQFVQVLLMQQMWWKMGLF